MPLPPPGVQEPAGQTCFILVDKVDPGQSASDVVGSGCHTGADKTPPAQVATEPQTDPVPRFRAQAPSAAAAAAASVPIMEVYAGTNYGGKSFIVYGNQGPCDASGYTISDANDINDTVGGASSYRTYNGCDNHKIYNQTDLRGTPASYVGSGISALPAAYDNKIASVKLRTNCSYYSQTGRSVCGAIRDKYETLGGPASLGYPTSNELTNPDNVGKRNTFQGGSSIYWSSSTPASQIGGAIYGKWGQLNYEKGILGYPTTDELITSDGGGRQNSFARDNGRVIWSAATDAHELHGGVTTKYDQTGGVTGCHSYPMSDVTTTADGTSTQFRGGMMRPSWRGPSTIIYDNASRSVVSSCKTPPPGTHPMLQQLAQNASGTRHPELVPLMVDMANRSQQYITDETLADGTRVFNAPMMRMETTTSNFAAAAPGPVFSPAGCRIQYVDNPHPSREFGYAGINFHTKVQCDRPVPYVSLNGALLNNTDTDIARRSAVERENVPFVENFNNGKLCTGPTPYAFQGSAGAYSEEFNPEKGANDVFFNALFGNEVWNNCEYRRGDPANP